MSVKVNSRACWICGAEADSREHIVKRSDLRALFSDHRRLYVYRGRNRPLFAQGTGSDLLKYGKTLCSICNNSRTQPHDRAWGSLSRFIQAQEHGLNAGDRINFANVFPVKTRAQMVNTHLFFVKLFGCLVVQSGAPLDVGPMAHAIRTGTSHSKIWIRFRPAFVPNGFSIMGRSHLETTWKNGRVVHAAWTYELGFVAVDIMFLESGEDRQNLIGAWHPYQRATAALVMAV